MSRKQLVQLITTKLVNFRWHLFWCTITLDMVMLSIWTNFCRWWTTKEKRKFFSIIHNQIFDVYIHFVRRKPDVARYWWKKSSSCLGFPENLTMWKKIFAFLLFIQFNSFWRSIWVKILVLHWSIYSVSPMRKQNRLLSSWIYINFKTETREYRRFILPKKNPKVIILHSKEKKNKLSIPFFDVFFSKRDIIFVESENNI